MCDAMRTAFHQQLDALCTEIADICGLAGVAMERATQALLQADLVLAEDVITDHDAFRSRIAEAEEAAITLLALQSPVASDLRLVVSSLTNLADVDATPRRRCLRMSTVTSPRWGVSRSTSVTASKTLCSLGIQIGRRNSTTMTTIWTTCIGTCSRCTWTASGSTVSPPQST